MTRCAAYLRISKDNEGLGLGIDLQWHPVTELAASKGWVIDPLWRIEENGVSARDDSKPRPGFELLLAGMEPGQVEAVVVYAFDRLARRLRDTARVLEVVDKHNVAIATSTGDLDLSTAYGRGIAGILGSIANMEITQMSERYRATAEQNARAGKVVNGGRRRYGYSTDRKRLQKREAHEIRQMADRIIGGASLSSVVRDLNDRGVQTSYKTRWTIKKMRTTLSHPALCGRVEFRGEIMRGVVGQWPAILDEETFDRLQIAMAARSRTEDAWVNHRVHLLSGLARCGIEGCGAKMMAHMQTNDQWTYTCSARKHLGRNRTLLDGHVLAEVRRRAAETFVAVPEWVDEDQAEARRRTAELEDQKAASVRELVDNRIDAATLVAVTTEYDARLGDLRAAQVDDVALSDRVKSVVFDLDHIDSMTLVEQRAAIDLYVSSLTVLPTKRRGRGFDPTSVEILWRDLSRMRWHAVVDQS